MAHLIPPTIPADEPSEGERLVFERFGNDHAHGDWTVFHSLDIANHRRQLEGEIDFLCVAPGKGVLVLEVKGCHELHRGQGLWYYGNDHRGDSRGPFKQASEAMHSIRGRLVKRHPELAHVVFWSAVCFPFIDFREPSEEWHSWQVIDGRALRARSIGDLCEGVLDQARKLLVEKQIPWFHAEEHAPTEQQCQALVNALRPDFEFFESPKSRVRRLDEEIKHFTEEQFAALDQIEANPRIVFDGPAGTGKTLLAIEAARRSIVRSAAGCATRLPISSRVAAAAPISAPDPASSRARSMSTCVCSPASRRRSNKSAASSSGARSCRTWRLRRCSSARRRSMR
jgi:hypothetical protein